MNPYQNLFNHLSDRYNLLLLESDMDEIIRIVQADFCNQEPTNSVADDIMNLFNQNNNQMQKATKMTDVRRRTIKKAIKIYGIAEVKNVIIDATNSAYLNGENTIGWKASFDWIIAPKNFVKILEGNYKNKQNGKPDNKPQFNQNPTPSGNNNSNRNSNTNNTGIQSRKMSYRELVAKASGQKPEPTCEGGDNTIEAEVVE